MKKLFLIFTFCILASLSANDSYPSSLPSPLAAASEGNLVVNNRVLIKVQGKTISVMDVVKKMDIYLDQNYPEIASSVYQRFQFYTSQWKKILAEMIDAELMIADAEKLELKITDAEVREQIHERFGPNIMKNLNKYHITYDEAKKMVWTDMVVQRMSWYRIHAKALQNINPKDIRKAYQAYCKSHPPRDEWKYEVLAIKSPSKEASSKVAQEALHLIELTQAGLKNAAQVLQSKIAEANQKEMSITVSDVITASDKEISEAHRSVLIGLKEGSFSQPIEQTSRISGETVQRVFHLLEHTKREPPSFRSMAETLKEDLLQNEAQRIRQGYITKIRKRFGYDNDYIENIVPPDFQPFALSY